MRKILLSFALFFGLATGKAFASCSASMPYTFTATSYLSYVTTNANNNFLLACVSTVDNTQIGGAGLYASQIIPTSPGNATFGGSQTYTFPSNIVVTGGTTTNGFINNGAATVTGTAIVGALSSSGAISGTTGSYTGTLNSSSNIVFGGSSGGTLYGVTGGGHNAGDAAISGNFSASGTESNAGSTSTGAVQQTVSATNYTIPYDAQSTAASTNTHMEHGTLPTGTYSGGFACSASHNFTKTYTASPTIILTNASASAPMGNPYPGSVSGSAFTACVFLSGQASGTGTLNWMSIGE